MTCTTKYNIKYVSIIGTIQITIFYFDITISLFLLDSLIVGFLFKLICKVFIFLMRIMENLCTTDYVFELKGKNRQNRMKRS